MRASSSKAEHALESLAFFHQGRASVVMSWETTRFVVRIRGEVFRSGSRFLLTSICDFCLRDQKVPSSHFSHNRRMSLEERLLLGLPHRSQRRTGFGRHIEVSGGSCVAVRSYIRQGNQEAAGPWYVRSELWVVKTSCRLGVSGWRGNSMNKERGSGMDSIWGNTVWSWWR